MISEDRLARALHDVADGVAAPEVDLAAVRSRARAKRTRAVTATAVTTAVAVIVAGPTVLGGGDRNATLPAASPLPSTSESATSPDGYTSAQYGFTIVPPDGWHYEAADRTWVWESDVRTHTWNSQSHENFSSPGDGGVVVSAWAVPLAPGAVPESRAALNAWVKNYCLSSGESPCAGMADRAVELCVEGSGCSVGLLGRVTGASYAFFTGGTHGSDTMTIVAVWRSETDVSVAPYGGARKLLERFLASMDVRPSTAETPPPD